MKTGGIVPPMVEHVFTRARKFPRWTHSVDSPEDLKKVEAHMREDPLWGTY